MIVAVDTGGTKTLVSLFTHKGELRTHIKFATPKNTVKYLELLRQALAEMATRGTIDIISIALPGIIKNDVAVWCNNLGWQNFDIKKELGPVLGGIPILVENDANLAGLAEVRLLKPTPLNALYVTFSTGIGTGFVTHGKIDPGLRLSEGGHALVEYDGRVREWESFASGKAVYETYGKYARDITSQKQWRHIADRMSRGFLALIPITQPEVIIIGGSIGTYFERYEQHLTGLLRERLPQHIPCPQLVQARHPEHAVVYGGFYYARDLLARR